MLIKVRGLTKNYGDKKVLNNLDLDIPERGIVLLKGANGAGKSTLIKIISKFTKYDSGMIRYSDARFFQKSSYLLDQPILLDNLTFHDNIEFIGNLLKLDRAFVKTQADQFSALFQLPTDLYYGNYSLGMRKKAEIARTLLGDPSYIFWDEPFNSLDHESVSLIIDKVINKKKLFFIVTHHEALDNISETTFFL